MTEHTEHTEPTGGRRWSRWRIAAWATATFLFLLPLLAMQVTGEVNWTVGDFVFAGVLLFGTLSLYEVVARLSHNTAYRTGVGVALVAAFLLVWINAAVGITDSEADGGYLLVLVIGIVGAVVARFRPAGMARAMIATALALTLVAVIALLSGVVPPHNPPFKILALTGLFVVPFVGSALLFREAAREARDGDAT